MKQLVVTLLLMTSVCAVAQKHVSVKSTVVFYSKALIEDITAKNTKSKSVIDVAEGKIAFSIPISGFKFRKSLMEEHFNEKYLESDKFPKATFSATLVGFEKGVSQEEMIANGVLQIHGVKQDVQVPGSITFQGNKISVHCVFKIKIADYNIKIPRLMFQNIAEEIEITIDFEYDTNEK